MSFLATSLLLVALTFHAKCDGSSDIARAQNDISDLIRNFQLCDVKCNGKSCECCQKIGDPFNVEVCGSSSLRIAEKSLDLTLKVEGEVMAKTTAKLDRMLNICLPVKTKGGNLGICIVTSLADDTSNPGAVKICINVDVSVEGVNFVRVGINCVKFDGGIQIEGQTSQGLKNFGYVKVVNGEQLARLVQRIVIG